jgi:predicted nucleotide-binding protein
MEKKKYYGDIRFSPEAIREAADQLRSYFGKKQHENLIQTLDIDLLSGESWSHNTEDEFFADYRSDHPSSVYGLLTIGYGMRLGYSCYSYGRGTQVSVTAESRSEIESIFEILEKHAANCTLPPLPKDEPSVSKPIVFIGHGRSIQWRDLKDHLHDKHGYDVEAYEIGSRAGHAIRDILEDMLSKSSFAILVMTGEDKDEKGNLRARQNVIHELGLFQGRLGFSRAIILLEEETKEFSNIHGINQIRYSKDNIKETYGDILAALRREFGEP